MMTAGDVHRYQCSGLRGQPMEPRCLIGRAPPSCEQWLRASYDQPTLREYISVMTRQQIWGRPLTLAQAVADTTEFLGQFTVLEDGPLVWDRFTMLSRRYTFAGRQVHDANIVATMLARDEHRLLTFNTTDFRRFTRLIEVLSP